MGKVRDAQADEIANDLARRHGTAIVLLHHAVAERLGLGPADHKCLDLLRERGSLSGSELAALTGLTSGAITGVVARLEQAGYLRREADPDDQRRQILRPVRERLSGIGALMAPMRAEIATMLDGFDARQRAAIAAFLSGCTDAAYRQTALLRGHALLDAPAAEPKRAAGGRRR